MRLLLHIGTEKTGTTALQEHLEAHRDLLLESGIALADFLESSNHRALASVFMDDSLDDDYLRAHDIVQPGKRAGHRQELLDKLRDSVSRASAQAHSYLISSEHFHSRLLARAEVQRFADAVTPLFDEVRVICYLRRQDRMALSFYSQKLRGGFIPPSILPVHNVRRLHPKLPPFFDFEALLQRWSDALGSHCIEPAIYSRCELREGNVVADFYQRIGCAYPGDGDRPVANESLSETAQMALLAFNRAHGGDLQARASARELRERLNGFLQRRSPGPGVLPADAEADEFLAAFGTSNARVARRWFGRDRLFPVDDMEYPPQESSADWEAVAGLLCEFMATMAAPAGEH